MPWFIDPNNRVIAGTKENPGKRVKCHPDREAATAHMRALYANLPEEEKETVLTIKRGKKSIPLVEGLYNFRENGQERWVCISTIALSDNDGETYTTEAIDWGIQWVKENDEYPELRVIHIKGLKAGRADKMSRIGPLAVDEGVYFDTSLAKETRRVVNEGNMRISRGFSVVEASGRCPTCASRLRVGPVGLKFAFVCPACNSVNLGRALKELHFTKAIPFDLTVTDRPAVPLTVIVNKEESIMTREEIISRLVEAGFKEDIVSPIVDALPEEDLQRMKDDTLVQQFKELIEPATKEGGSDDEDEEPRSVTPNDSGVFKCFKCGSRMRLGRREKEFGETLETRGHDIEIDDAVIAVIASSVADKLKEGILPPELELEIPGLDERFGAIETKLTEVGEAIMELAKSEDEKLARYAEDLSPASKTSLKYRLSFKDSSGITPPPSAVEKTKDKDNGDMQIVAPDGQAFPSMSAYMGLEPGE